MPSTPASVGKDELARMERWLDELNDGRLAQRIAEAARLAMVRHIHLTAQEMRSPVEAEHSTQDA